MPSVDVLSSLVSVPELPAPGRPGGQHNEAPMAPSAPQMQPETEMPPSSTEERLLDLLQQHLAGTERAIGELRSGMNQLSDRFEAASNRLFVLSLLLVVAIVATSGANLYITYQQGTVKVATGDASVTGAP